MVYRLIRYLDRVPFPLKLEGVAWVKCQIQACYENAGHFIEETGQTLCHGHAILAYLLWESCTRGVPSDPIDAANQWAKSQRIPHRIPESDRDALRDYLKEAARLNAEL